MVGYETSDDAGIYRLNDETAIITTADFITPPTNDGYLYGQIAAANALSDVYAMGGQPIACLNLMAFPADKLDPEIIHQVVAGAVDKIAEAGAVLAGGHTTENDEPLFGLSVTGIVHPQRYWTNAGAKTDDVIVLTKPLGSGVLFNANLKKWVSTSAIQACHQVITALNRTAAQIMKGFDIHAVTDVTGFGVLGHGYEMARASNVQLHIAIQKLPIMAEALEMYEKGVSTKVNRHNRELVAKYLRFDIKVPFWHAEILIDPQTSGGLLATLPAHQGDKLIQALHAAGVAHAAIIGTVKSKDDSGAYLKIS